MFACLLAACYTPLNNAGVATTKPWLEISGKKTDFDGNQYDSCYRFNVRFWPQEAAEKLDLQATCISACCWRTHKTEVTLDFNKNFEADLARYGRARKYNPGKITLAVNHANWLNTTRVSVTPKGAISNDGLIKLSYKNYENPTRLAQLAQQARTPQTRTQPPSVSPAITHPAATHPAKPKPAAATPATLSVKKTTPVDPAKTLVQRTAGPKIDTYFYQMNKRYNKQGAVFLLSERLLYVQPTQDGNYMVSCLAKARTGLDAAHLKASTFPCGQWQVNLAQETVLPYDSRAQLIWDM